MKIQVKNEKFLHCPECGTNYGRYNEDILLLKRIAFVAIEKTGDKTITVKCAKCKHEIKIKST